jgi:hypothetical protein
MWDFLFSATNIWALLGWAALIFLPRLPAVLSSIMYAVIGLLCLVYLVSFSLLLSGAVDVGGAGGAGTNLTSISGIRDLFATDAGVVIGWTHYLALDLFAGLWIARDADAKGFGRIAQAPILLLTLAVAPVGLLLWLIIRERRARIQAKTKTFA